MSKPKFSLKSLDKFIKKTTYIKEPGVYVGVDMKIDFEYEEDSFSFVPKGNNKNLIAKLVLTSKEGEIISDSIWGFWGKEPSKVEEGEELSAFLTGINRLTERFGALTDHSSDKMDANIVLDQLTVDPETWNNRLPEEAIADYGIKKVTPLTELVIKTFKDDEEIMALEGEDEKYTMCLLKWYAAYVHQPIVEESEYGMVNYFTNQVFEYFNKCVEELKEVKFKFSIAYSDAQNKWKNLRKVTSYSTDLKLSAADLKIIEEVQKNEAGMAEDNSPAKAKKGKIKIGR